jgi:hypothetical protein
VIFVGGLGEMRSSRIGEIGGSAIEEEGGGVAEIIGEVGGGDWWGAGPSGTRI